MAKFRGKSFILFVKNIFVKLIKKNKNINININTRRKMSIATKYERVNPNEEKLKRLYNCNRMSEEDQKYLNYQFERYKLRSFHVVGAVGVVSFVLGSIPFIKSSSSYKYWSSILVGCFSLYKFLTMRNNIHFEQIATPYFEKYRVK